MDSLNSMTLSQPPQLSLQPNGLAPLAPTLEGEPSFCPVIAPPPLVPMEKAPAQQRPLKRNQTEPAGNDSRARLYKTKMCAVYPLGRCHNGADCHFAHDESELRTLPNLRQTSLCHQFMRTGTCSASNCGYAHGYADLRATNEVFKTSLCTFWSNGNCKYGMFCRHAHGHGELRSEGTAPPAQSKVPTEKKPRSLQKASTFQVDSRHQQSRTNRYNTNNNNNTTKTGTKTVSTTDTSTTQNKHSKSTRPRKHLSKCSTLDSDHGMSFTPNPDDEAMAAKSLVADIRAQKRANKLSQHTSGQSMDGKKQKVLRRQNNVSDLEAGSVVLLPVGSIDSKPVQSRFESFSQMHHSMPPPGPYGGSSSTALRSPYGGSSSTNGKGFQKGMSPGPLHNFGPSRQLNPQNSLGAVPECGPMQPLPQPDFLQQQPPPQHFQPIAQSPMTPSQANWQQPMPQPGSAGQFQPMMQPIMATPDQQQPMMLLQPTPTNQNQQQNQFCLPDLPDMGSAPPSQQQQQQRHQQQPPQQQPQQQHQLQTPTPMSNNNPLLMPCQPTNVRLDFSNVKPMIRQDGRASPDQGMLMMNGQQLNIVSQSPMPGHNNRNMLQQQTPVSYTGNTLGNDTMGMAPAGGMILQMTPQVSMPTPVQFAQHPQSSPQLPYACATPVLPNAPETPQGNAEKMLKAAMPQSYEE